MRERTVEKHLVDRVKATGGIVRKVQWIGHRGAPDRLVGWPRLGRTVFVEMKRPLTPHAKAHQAREHKKLQELGLDVRVLASIEDVDVFIEEMVG